jgi:hypothetical protein
MFVLPRRAAAAACCLATLVTALALAGCRKKSPPAPPPTAQPAPTARPLAASRPDAAPISCPAPESFATLAAKKGRTLRSGCVVLYEGFYWGAAALTYNEKGPAQPALHFLTGGPHSRTLVFDVEPAPAKEIEALIRGSREVAVNIRRPRGDRSLVRMGVVGKSGTADKPQSREIGVLLQLVAHSPPKILWWGPGDETSVEANGCVHEQTVDFELLFRTRLQRFTTSRARPPADGKPETGCSPPSSMQDEVAYQATAIKSPRPLQP